MHDIVAGLILFVGRHSLAQMGYGEMVVALYDESRAVKRVAPNETLIGICFIGGPALASLLHSGDQPYAKPYIILSLLLCTGLALQTVMTGFLLRKGNDRCTNDPRNHVSTGLI